MPDLVQLFAPDEEATSAIGVELAGLVQQGDLVLLGGDLGSGKTTLARALIRARMSDPGLEVPSPSFALVQPYDTPSGPLLHVDLYRLSSAAEIGELGVLDELEALVLLEWPDRAPELLVRARLSITFSLPQEGFGRRLVLETRDRALGEAFGALAARYPGLA
jgi:tRNA threonylcarbamoyl adenosine modification protein YjeE